MDSTTVAATATRLICKQVPDWPRLAWVAMVRRHLETVWVLHGRCVETTPTSCVEAVWPGKFHEADFDLSDIVIGTGIRVRPDSIRFVSSSDTLNRLYYFEDEERTLFVANSLPALLAVADLDLVPDFDYGRAMLSIRNGLVTHAREIRSSRGNIRLLYLHNLIVTKSRATIVAKRAAAPEMDDFATYRDYLFGIAQRVGENSRAPARRHRITPLATVSKGYDSPVSAILARAAGTQAAVTIATARRYAGNPFHIDDSGADVAAQLGLSCKIYKRTQRDYPHEDAIWAAIANVGDLNLTTFDYPQPLCLLFTGFNGGSLWDRDLQPTEPLRRKDTSGARFSEARLELGVFNCAPAYWGFAKADQIRALARRPEMLPWTLGSDYDRPVPRRFAEEAGLRRGSFATRKMASSFNRKYGRPLSVSLRKDFADFMRRHGGRAAPGLVEGTALALRALDALVLRRLRPRLRVECKSWIKLPVPSMFFIWANERRRAHYLAGLRQADLLHEARLPRSERRVEVFHRDAATKGSS
jgi:hypothetical protein